MTLLELRNISRVFPGTVALKEFSARWEGGRIHALIGRNGAGKSTLVNILTGALPPTSGTILLDDVPLHFRSPADARRAGIAAVYQELSLLPDLDVVENVHLGRLPVRKGALPGRVDWKAAERHTRALLDRLHISLPLHTPIRHLSVARQQLVEIVKAMGSAPRVLLCDEPTSALSYQEASCVFALLRTLADEGVLVVYITHRLQEIRSFADTVTALRDGLSAGTTPSAEATPERMVTMMFGEDVRFTRMVDHLPSPSVVLEVRGLTRKQGFSDVSFSLHAGEVLGIAGLMGSGRTELLRALAGADTPDAGDLVIHGQPCVPQSPAQMKRFGVVMTPENRKDDGLVTLLSTRINISLASLDRLAPHAITSRRREQECVTRMQKELDIALTDSESPVSSLSGGNQQKVVLGKWLATDPQVMLLDEPTRGIDLKAKAQMFQTVLRLSRQGMGILIVSSELEELLLLCHRLLFMQHGRITGSADAGSTSLETLLARCMESS
ncbi:MAG TPA: sugar ABC transporter ATP-binding protein [Bacteroidota bacterium]|nr:sugar ABC transporter ATP-binding protein [Bacteroidota bacterium]